MPAYIPLPCPNVSQHHPSVRADHVYIATFARRIQRNLSNMYFCVRYLRCNGLVTTRKGRKDWMSLLLYVFVLNTIMGQIGGLVYHDVDWDGLINLMQNGYHAYRVIWRLSSTWTAAQTGS
jgi:hypothetical protein